MSTEAKQATCHPKLAAAMRDDSWKETRAKLYAFVRRRLGKELAAEIVQQTELRMLSGSAVYDGVMDPFKFACRVARNVGSERKRSAKRRAKHETGWTPTRDDDAEAPPSSRGNPEDNVAVPPSRGSPEDHTAARETRAIYAEVEALVLPTFGEGSLEQRIVARTKAGLTLEQIADETGVPNKKLHDALNRYIRAMRAELAKRGIIERKKKP